MPDIHYTSGNVESLSNVDLVTNVKPNTTYTFTLENLVHLKSYDNPSGLSYSNVIYYNGNVHTPGTDTIQIITASDNVSVDLELVRNGNSIDAHVSNFSSDYADYNYTFKLRAYNGSDSSVKSYTTDSDSFVMQSFTGLSDITTNAYYFELNDFYNDTVKCNVYANIDTKPNRLTQRVYDVHGLAYFRSSYNNYNLLNSLTTVDNLRDVNTHTRTISISGDGNFMVVTFHLHDNIINSPDISVFYTFRLRNNEWQRMHAQDWSNGSPRKALKRYPRLAIRDSFDDHKVERGVVKVSNDGTQLVATAHGSFALFDINPFTGTVTAIGSQLHILVDITTYPELHDLSLSSDGNKILVSRNLATSNGGISLSGGRGGHAYVLTTFDGGNSNWSNEGNLHSELITNFNASYYYGSDSALSGDGKTAVIMGSLSNDTLSGHGYVWKYNDFTQDWRYVASVSFGYRRHRAPCSLSHDGKAFFVCSSRGSPSRACVFETVDYATWTPTSLIADNEVPVYTGSISGDGKTVVVVSNTKLHVFAKEGSSWISKTQTPTLDESEGGAADLYDVCSLSFDGSTVSVRRRGGYNSNFDKQHVFTYRIDKSGTVDTVLDYQNVKSYYGPIYYDELPNVGDWSSFSPTPTTLHVSAYNYGIVDALAISADGRYVLVGSPSENRAYLYNTTDGSLVYPAYSGSNNFGIKCGMDDKGEYIVISNNSKFHAYRGDVLIDSWDHYLTNPLWNFKMSKDGNAIVASGEKAETNSFKVWTTTDNWSSRTEHPITNTGRRLGAVDVSKDGSVLVAAGFGGGVLEGDTHGGYVLIFEASTGNILADVKITTTSNNRRYVGQSVAISGLNASGEYTIIVGEPQTFSGPHHKTHFSIIKYKPDGNSYSGPVTHSISATTNARYGRSVSINYTGTHALLSGNREYLPTELERPQGSAIVVDTSTGEKIQEFPQTSLTFVGVPGYKPAWNGYGNACRMSSVGNEIVVSGGGYAFVYKNT